MTLEQKEKCDKYTACCYYSTLNGWRVVLKQQYRTPDGSILVAGTSWGDACDNAAALACPATEEQINKYQEEKKWLDLNIR